MALIWYFGQVKVIFYESYWWGSDWLTNLLHFHTVSHPFQFPYHLSPFLPKFYLPLLQIQKFQRFASICSWGGNSFGTGVISFLFQIIGYTPEINIELIRLVTLQICNSSANIWTSFMGRWPMTLEDFLLRLFITFCTFSGDVIFSKYI